MFPSCPQLPHKVLVLLIILLLPRWQPGLSFVWAARDDMVLSVSAITCMITCLERRFLECLEAVLDWVLTSNHLKFHLILVWNKCSQLRNKDLFEWKQENMVARCLHAWRFQLQPHLHKAHRLENRREAESFHENPASFSHWVCCDWSYLSDACKSKALIRLNIAQTLSLTHEVS